MSRTAAARKPKEQKLLPRPKRLAPTVTRQQWRELRAIYRELQNIDWRVEKIMRSVGVRS